MPQTVHAQDMPQAHPGLVADSATVQDTISRIAEQAAGVHAGTFMIPGTDAEQQALAPTATGEVSDGDGLGVVQYDASKMPARTAAALADESEYDDEDVLPILTKGRIWVLCDAAATITANTPAFVRFVAAGAEVLGAFREDADGGDAVAMPNAIFRTAHQDVVLQADTYRVALLSINQPTG